MDKNLHKFDTATMFIKQEDGSNAKTRKMMHRFECLRARTITQAPSDTVTALDLAVTPIQFQKHMIPIHAANRSVDTVLSGALRRAGGRVGTQ